MTLPLQMSKLLDLHLSRSIDRHNTREAVTNKFRELAEGIAGDIKNFNQQADELMARREALRQRGETVFARHREHQDDVNAGLLAMERAVDELEGSNSRGNEEGSGGTSGQSKG